MDKETLSHYGWIVILVLILAVLLALASPFGNFVAGAIKATTAGLFDVNQGALGAAGITIPGQSMDDTNTDEPVDNIPAYDHNAEELHPDNGSTPKSGDRYSYGNYEYMYKGVWYGSYWGTSSSYTGWGVRCINDVADPGPILESINGEPVTQMYGTFKNCTSLERAPIVPANVKIMEFAFYSCTNLKTYAGSAEANGYFSMYVIPNSVTNLRHTFSECTQLTSAPAIPSSVTTMEGTFSGCVSLKTYYRNIDGDGNFTNYNIPNSVTTMSKTFQNCTSLIVAPKLPNSVTNLHSTFGDCVNLTTAPTIPSSATGVDSIFSNCASLKTYHNATKDTFDGYVLPETIQGISNTFKNCTSLTGTIEINAVLSNNTGYYNNCFAGVDFEMQNITLTGSCTSGSYSALDYIGKTGINYCTTCNGKCQNNH